MAVAEAEDKGVEEKEGEPEATARGEGSSDRAPPILQRGPEARTPNTKKAPIGMTAAEWNMHRLTHLPYNPGCRCCVAGRKRDDPHRRRKSGEVQADMDSSNGSTIHAE